MYMNSENQVLTFWSKVIKYTLLQLDRKTLDIEVTPEMEVIVRAPLNSRLESILDKVRKKAPWIFKQINFFNEFHPKLTAKKYITWETFLYLWKQYILKVEITTESEKVRLKWKYLMVFVKNTDNSKKVVESWYLKRAKENFKKYSEWIIKKFEVYNVKPWKISIRKMKSRWGSCSKKGNITLNSDLIRAPRGCIEYVLTHECSHLLEYWHTKRFYEIQTSQMPDWEKWKNKLERLLA